MKKISVLFIILFTLFLFSCKSKTTKKNVKKTAENNLLKQTIPQKGEIKLELEKVLSFDPSKTNLEALGAKIVEKDIEGNYYFVVPEKALVLKYSREGKFIGKICKYGLGPGEMRYVDYIKPVEDGIFLSNSREIMKVDEKGESIFKKNLKQIYSPLDIVDDKRYLASFYEIDKKEEKEKPFSYKKAFGLFDMNEHLIKKYANSKDVGMITVKTTKGVFSISIAGLNPSLEWSYDSKNDVIYYGFTNKYKIFAIQLDGKEKFSFGKVSKRISLSRNDRERIGKTFFRGLDKELRRAFLKELPDRLMSFSKIRVLPSGYIAIFVPNKNLSSSLDIFDNKGNYLYHLNPPEGIGFVELKFFSNGHIGYLKETDEGLFFIEYRVKKPEGIFYGKYK